MRTPPERPRSRSHGLPAPMCSFKECGRYCVRIITSAIPELTQLESVKSMIRYLPAKGTAGFALLSVRTPRREPSPPARMTARVFMRRLHRQRGPLAAMFGSGPFVEQRVLARGALPGRVPGHPSLHELSPCARISVHPSRADQSVLESRRNRLVEHDSRTSGVANVDDRVGESAGAPRHGHSSVAHADLLGQAAGLVTRWDPNDIRAGINSARVAAVESQTRAHAGGEGELPACELLFERRFACPEQYQLAARFDPPGQDCQREIESLLMRIDAGND